MQDLRILITNAKHSSLLFSRKYYKNQSTTQILLLVKINNFKVHLYCFLIREMQLKLLEVCLLTKLVSLSIPSITLCQNHTILITNIKPSVERLSKCSQDSVDENHVPRDAVKRQ